MSTPVLVGFRLLSYQPQKITASSLDIPVAPQIVGCWHFVILCEVAGVDPPLLALTGTVLFVVIEERASIFLKITWNHNTNTRATIYR